MLNTFKTYWNKIPTVIQLQQYLTRLMPKYGALLVYPLVFVWLFVATMLPFTVANASYPVALFIITLSRLLMVAFIVFVMRSILSRVLRGFLLIMAIATMFELVNVFVPMVTPTSNGRQHLMTDNTYVTFLPACPYCRKAHTNIKRAVNVYNLTHIRQLKFVNLAGSDELASAARHVVIHKGEILRINHRAQMTHVTYTIGNAKGPLTPSTSYLYHLLQNKK